jgi:hypothetical protein
MPSMTEAFALAAGELGMLSAARLFVREASAAGGDDAVAAVRASLAPSFPVFDAVASRALAHDPVPQPDLDSVCAVLEGCARVLFVGLEVECLEPLVRRLRASTSDLRVGVVLDMNLPFDEARVRANLEALEPGGVQMVRLSEFQRFSGRRSALITPVYGSDGFRAVVCSSWVRIHGPDARTQFRALIGWDVLGAPLQAYPRWLSETSAADFTSFVPAGTTRSESP